MVVPLGPVRLDDRAGSVAVGQNIGVFFNDQAGFAVVEEQIEQAPRVVVKRELRNRLCC